MLGSPVSPMSRLHETVSVETMVRLPMLQTMPLASQGFGFICIPTRAYTDSALIEILEIPKYLNSVEFLMFVGFYFSTAHAIFNEWEMTKTEDGDLEGVPVGMLIDCALSWIRKKAKIFDVTEAEENWDECLRNMGLSADFRDRLLDPSFDWLRLSKSASHWAIDSIESDYHFLFNLEKSIWKRMESQSVCSSVTGGLFSDHEPQNTVYKAREAECEQAWRYMLFKGGRESQLRRCIEDNGDVDLGWLAAKPPSDFHPTTRDHIYLTAHHYVAEQYAAYAERRSHCGDRAAVLTVSIPNEYITYDHTVSSNWHDLVWYSLHPSLSKARDKKGSRTLPSEIKIRDEEGSRILPEHLQLYEQEGLLIGPVPNASAQRMPKLSNPNSIGLLKLPNGDTVSHYVIRGEVFRKELEESCRDFVWIRLRGDDAMSNNGMPTYDNTGDTHKPLKIKLTEVK
jgi:hypothetical protein